ncbi:MULTISPECIES: SpoIIIAC/SpoIIIAD family protein [Thermoanaerobacterium]|jgi:Stage III sporulation protein AC/AD protein family.|uniref:Stage III sporulation protein AC/AD protein family n=3 Tax=Thermoanaerobacterium TaxID=28895 RepID=L0IQA3_THETR|nr:MULTISPECIES: SpoIIIAC/SpoIIIAD family protein [Thermoanaerobacterium]AFK94350.1 Stage III sporulation AC family protein [Thermoanaerobacterium saccharolyticum JW/SL-YS485]AGB20386.1 Stage III sporulation protein AC/AD protein family [Thermoanaerobacterium thermosaccharolyticum M0795]ETO39120.1 Stage III sporulation AC family protein [Thermoanaerobacterium aotearoense SCUT27]
MDIIARLFGLGIIIVVADRVLSEAGQKNIAFFVTLAGVVIGLAMVVPKIYELFTTVQNTFNVH